MEMMRRSVSLLLALVMVLSLSPLPVAATETAPEATEIALETTPETEEIPAEVTEETVPEEDSSEEAVEPVPEEVPSEATEVSVPAEEATEEAEETVPAEEPSEETEASAELPEETENPAGRAAYGMPYSEEEDFCGEELTWAFDASSATLTISGTGEMTSAPWLEEHRDSIRNVVLPDGLADICRSAFEGCSLLKSVDIPDSVTYIGAYAFSGCSSLSNVKLSAGLEGIAWSAFNSCISLPEITIPKGLQEVESGNWGGVFEGCSSLKTISLEKGMKEVPDYLFFKCQNLTTINWAASLTCIGAHAFDNCISLKEVTIPDAVLTVGESAFQNCTGLETVNLGQYADTLEQKAFAGCTALENVNCNPCLKTIDREVFSGCTALKKIDIADSVTYIGSSAFADCTSLADVQLPANLEVIGWHAFRNCITLPEITIPKELQEVESGNWGGVFEDCSSLKTAYMEEGLTVIPDYLFFNCTTLEKIDLLYSLTHIGAHAFDNCISLTEVTFPDALLTVGEAAYLNCTGLKTVNLGQYVDTLGQKAFAGCTALENVNCNPYLKTIEREVFSGCTALKKIDIADSVTNIGAAAFAECASLVDVQLPANLKVIGWHAFRNCISLPEITIPKELQEVEYGNWGGVFEGCSSLKTAYMEEGLTVIPDYLFFNCTTLEKIDLLYSLTHIGAHAFDNCISLTEVTFPDALLTVGEAAYLNCTGLKTVNLGQYVDTLCQKAFAGCTALVNVNCNSYLKTIEREVFSGCTALKKIDIADSVTSIGAAAFAECASLADVQLPANLEIIGWYAFRNCVSLPEITIPQALREVEYGNWGGVFDGCESLAKVTLEEGIPAVPDYLFLSATGLQNVEIPKTVTVVGIHAFRDSGLLSIALPESVKEIGEAAFQGCLSMKEATLPDGIHTIGKSAFCDCDALQTIALPADLLVVEMDTFKDCDALVSVEFPENLLMVESTAFYHCDSLREVTIPHWVQEIGRYAFAECALLSNVVIGDGVHTIRESAFVSCPELKTVTFGESVSCICHRAFAECILLESVTLGDRATKLESSAFENCDSLVSADLGQGLRIIGESCFYDCDGLKTVTMGNNVTEMGNSAFEHCDILENVTLSLNLPRIPDYAFKECAQLTQIVIPYYCVSIGDYAFNRSPRLVKVVTYAGLSAIGEEAFSYPNLTVFYGVADSYTQRWCEANGFKFVANTVPASKVTLPEEDVYLNKHDTYTLVPYIEPADFSDAIVYKSNNNAVVTVDAAGNLIAQDTCGTAIIKVTVGTVSDTVKVHVIDSVSHITLNETELTLQITAEKKEAFQLNMQTVPEGVPLDSVVWSTSDSNVVTVSEGLVQAVAPGKATVTVEILTLTGESHTAQCQVEVILGGVIQQIVLDKSNATLEDMDTLQLKANVSPDACAGNPLVWSSSDETVATVDQKGLVTATGKGKAVITVAADDGGGAKAECTITVTNNIYYVTDKSQLESPHPYDNSCSDIWIYTEPGAEYIELHFAPETMLEEGFDYLDIYCGVGNLVGSFSSSALSDEVVQVPGDTAKLQLMADEAGSEWGFKVLGDSPAPEHTVVIDPGKEPTCEEPGLTEGSHCSKCGVILVEQKQIPALEHVIVTDPAVEPTCTQDGRTEGSHCDLCGKIFVEPQPIPGGHDVIPIPAVPATCEEPGLTEGAKCEACGVTLEEQYPTDPLGHEETVLEAVKPTCQTPGLTEGKKCSRCEKILIAQEKIDPVAHKYENGECIYCQEPEPEILSGECGENLTWNFDPETGKLTVSGTGAMWDYSLVGKANHPDTPWYDLRDGILSICVEAGVTSIGNNAFGDLEKAADILLPQGLQTLGNGCLSGSGLTEITIPDSVTSLGKACFSYCKSLTKLELPAGIAVIEEEFCYGCTALTGVVLPDGIESIGEFAFADCAALQFVVLLSGLEKIDSHAFLDCKNLKKISFTGNAPAVDKTAFEGVEATAYYPGTDDTWTKAVLQNYGGTITWVPVGSESADYEAYLEPEDVFVFEFEAEKKDRYTIYASGEDYLYVGISFRPIDEERPLDSCVSVRYGTDVEITRMLEAGIRCYVVVGFSDYESAGTVRCGWRLSHEFDYDGMDPPACAQQGQREMQCIHCNRSVPVTFPVDHTYENGACVRCGAPYIVELRVGYNHYQSEITNWQAKRAYFRFTPKYTESYTFNGDYGDGMAWLYDAEGNLLEFNDDASSGNFEFDITRTLEAGKTYYLVTEDYASDVASGYVYLRVNHDNGEPVVLYPGECGDYTELEYTCRICGEVTYDYVWISHEWVEGVTVGEAGCETEAVTTYTCTLCGDSYNSYDGAWGHSYENGSQTCAVCGKPFEMPSGICGDNLTWVLDQTGKLTISGTGDMYDYTYTSAPWDSMAVITLVVEEGVTSIGGEAFSFGSLEQVTLPKSLVKIGQKAFYYCNDLESLILPAGVAEIGTGAFANCDKLQDLRIDKNNKTFGTNGKGAILSKDGTVLYGVVGDAGEEYTIPDSVTTIASHAMYAQGFHQITVPGSVKTLADYAFAEDALNYDGCIRFLGDAPSFGSNAFANERGWDEVSHVVLYPGDNATWTKAVLQDYGGDPQWIPVYDTVASGRCGDNLTWTLDSDFLLTVSGTGDMWDFGYAYDEEGNEFYVDCPWEVYRGLISRVVIAPGVTGIGNNAFVECQRMKSVEIPDTVTRIGTYAFEFCYSLEEAILPDSVRLLGNYGIFWYCERLKTVHLPEGITAIPDAMFTGCVSLETVNIPSTVTYIGSSAFSRCASLETLVLPEGVTYIGEQAFQYCTSLRKINIPAGVRVLDRKLLRGCGSLVDVQLNEGLLKIADSVFWDCVSLREIQIPSTVKKLGWGVFAFCSSLVDVNIPNGVPYLGGTFWGCTSLSEIAVPDSVTEIGYWAFRDCTSLPQLAMPEQLQTLGDGILADSAVTKVTFSGSAPAFTQPGDEYKAGWSDMDAEGTFAGLTADAWYPQDDSSWTGDVLQNYGGHITWRPMSQPDQNLTIETATGLTYLLGGKKLQLTALLNGEIAQVSWQLQQEAAYAAINSKGLVTAKRPNEPKTVTVIATEETTQARAMLELTILPADTKLQILLDGEPVTDTLTLDMQKNGGLNLTAALNGQSVEAQWTSGSKAVAQVEDGTVTFLKPGYVTVTAKDAAGLTGTASFDVYYLDPAKKLTAFADLPAGGLETGRSVQLVVSGENVIDPENLIYTSSNEDLATVSPEGTITAGSAAGTVKITAAIQGDPLNRSVTLSLKIIAAQVHSLTLSPGEMTADVSLLSSVADERSFLVTPEARDADGNPVTLTDKSIKWTTSNKKAASVKATKDGCAIVTLGTKVGEAIITATVADELGTAAQLRVVLVDRGPKLESSTLNLNPMSTAGTDVLLVPHEDNAIQSVAIRHEALDVAYDPGTCILTLTANRAVKNGTLSTALEVECENGGTYVLNIKVVVKSAIPAITVKQSGKLNLFYADSTAFLTVTAKNTVVEKLELTDTQDFLLDEEGVLHPQTGLKQKFAENPKYKPDTKATLLVYLEGFALPVEKAITVSTVTTAPKLTTDPAASTLNTNDLYGGLPDIAFRIYDKTAKSVLDLEDEDTVIVAGYEEDTVVYTDIDEVTLTLPEAKKATLKVTIQKENWLKSVTLSHSVKLTAATPTVKLGKTTLKLNTCLPAQEDVTSAKLSSDNLGLTFTDFEAVKPNEHTDRIRVEYINADEAGDIVAYILDDGSGELPKAGNYMFRATPMANGEPLKPVTIKVSVSTAKPKVSLSAKGQLDTINPDSRLFYTVKQITNTTEPLEDVLMEEGGEYFILSDLETGEKGEQYFTLRLREDVVYSTKETYRVVLNYRICGEWFRSDALKIKVKQSPLKIKATVESYHDGDESLEVYVDLLSPDAALMEQISVNKEKTDKVLRKALEAVGTNLLEEPASEAYLSLTLADASGLKSGKSYKLVLDILPLGNAESAKPTQVTLTVKIPK